MWVRPIEKTLGCGWRCGAKEHHRRRPVGFLELSQLCPACPVFLLLGASRSSGWCEIPISHQPQQSVMSPLSSSPVGREGLPLPDAGVLQNAKRQAVKAEHLRAVRGADVGMVDKEPFRQEAGLFRHKQDEAAAFRWRLAKMAPHGFQAMGCLARPRSTDDKPHGHAALLSQPRDPVNAPYLSAARVPGTRNVGWAPPTSRLAGNPAG